jgi:hypothetical protein
MEELESLLCLVELGLLVVHLLVGLGLGCLEVALFHT